VGLRFNPPPNWPPPPPGFVPPPRWQPDPSWPPPPPGWQVWVDDPLPGERGAQAGQEDGHLGGAGGFAGGADGFAGGADGFAGGAPAIGGPTALDYLDGSYTYTPPAGPGPSSDRPNGFAVAAFVLGAIGGTILSVVLAIIALRQIKDTGQRGRGLAIAGLAFSVIWGAALAGFLFLYQPGSPARPPAGSSSPSSAGSSAAASPSGSSGASAGGAGHQGGAQQAANVFALRAGECLQNPPASQTVLGITYLTVVPCTTLHNAQVVVEFAATGTRYPGEAALKREADQGCHARLTGRVVNSRITSTMTLRFLYPLATSWSGGHRTISCLIVDSTTDLRRSLVRSR
jgi:Septum formation